MLKFPPLKPHRYTERIIVKKQEKYSNKAVFLMYDKKGCCLGRMETEPCVLRNRYHLYSPNSDKYSSLHIKRLNSFKRRVGVGSSLINAAKIESFKNFCNGNIHLVASDIFDAKRPPQVFYRKVGFEFGKHEIDTKKIVDDCIKNNKPVDKLLGDSFMYIERDVDESGESVKSLKQAKEMFSDIFNWL
ncbi:MAG: hypothetical protein V8S20_08430 [Candidatus Gastranaerophilaceae bacterium]